MLAAFLSDDYHLCLSEVDLKDLTNKKEISGNMLFHNDLLTCKVKIFKTKFSEVIFNLNENSPFFLFPKEVLDEILKYGTTTKTIYDSNFCVVSESHDQEEFLRRIKMINSINDSFKNQSVNTSQ